MCISFANQYFVYHVSLSFGRLLLKLQFHGRAAASGGSFPIVYRLHEFDCDQCGRARVGRRMASRTTSPSDVMTTIYNHQSVICLLGRLTTQQTDCTTLAYSMSH